MTVLRQPSMFDIVDELELTPLPGGVQRTELTDGAWIDHLPGWLTGSEQLLETLLADVPWRAERRQMYDREVDVPRLLCWYSGTTPLPHPILSRARSALNDYYHPELGEPFVTAGLCLPGRRRQRRLARRPDRQGCAHRHHGRDPLGRLGPSADAAPALRWVEPGPPPRSWRPDRDGWQLPANLGARDPEDGPTRRPTGQHPVPAGRGGLTVSRPARNQEVARNQDVMNGPLCRCGVAP